jgi:PIN domain nuclease of toxin-antitoxin system
LSYLVDTHAFIWRMRGDKRLPAAAREVLDETEEPVFFSAVSAFEIAYKHRIGKLPEMEGYVEDLLPAAARNRFAFLTLTAPSAFMAARLEIDHRDPFDRMLIAQALTDDLTFISNEAVADEAGVRRLW